MASGFPAPRPRLAGGQLHRSESVRGSQRQRSPPALSPPVRLAPKDGGTCCRTVSRWFRCRVRRALPCAIREPGDPGALRSSLDRPPDDPVVSRAAPRMLANRCGRTLKREPYMQLSGRGSARLIRRDPEHGRAARQRSPGRPAVSQPVSSILTAERLRGTATILSTDPGPYGESRHRGLQPRPDDVGGTAAGSSARVRAALGGQHTLRPMHRSPGRDRRQLRDLMVPRLDGVGTRRLAEDVRARPAPLGPMLGVPGGTARDTPTDRT